MSTVFFKIQFSSKYQKYVSSVIGDLSERQLKDFYGPGDCKKFIVTSFTTLLIFRTTPKNECPSYIEAVTLNFVILSGANEEFGFLFH